MSWHNKKTYINGKCLHAKGGTILLDAKRVVDPFLPVGVKEIERSIKGNGLTDVALKRLEALKPRALELSQIPKRQNIKF